MPPEAEGHDGPVEIMLCRYWRFLTVERSLAHVTARCYVDMVRSFLERRLSADGLALDLGHLTAANVTSFVVARCPRQSRGAAKLTVTALRSLLGFLHLDGIIERSLVSAVPSVAGRRLVGLPKGLDPDQVRRLLASCDGRTRRGCRDIAILTMLIRLGMRSGEVAKLRLDDIDWRAGEIVVRGKANCTERLPLPQDVGDRLAVYLQRGRPASAQGRTVFVRIKAPHRHLSSGRREQCRGRSRSTGGSRANPRPPSAPYSSDADATGRSVTAGDRATLASSPCSDDGDLRQGRSRRLASDRPPVAGRRPMNALRQALADYLAVRRALGYRLARAEKLLAQFLTFVEDRGEEHLTTETALAWATSAGRRRSKLDVQAALRRSPLCHSPPRDRPRHPGAADGHPARPNMPGDTVPLFGERNLRLDGGSGDIARVRTGRATYRTLIGLLAVTGMRVGEAIGLDRDDFDADQWPAHNPQRKVRQIPRIAAASEHRGHGPRRLSAPRRSSPSAAEVCRHCCRRSAGTRLLYMQRAAHIPATGPSLRHLTAIGSMQAQAP